MAQKQRQIQEQRQTVSFAEQAAASFLTGNMENGREIQIRHLSKAYGSHVVFRDFSLSIPMRTTTCLMAPSGAGKTTLLRILMGLETADGGTVTGMEHKKLSAVFQEPRLCENLSAFANIRMVRKTKLWEKDREGREEISRGMEALGLGGCERQPVREMSGGMRQRVALLRALYARWEILFLDEPTLGLDVIARHELWETIRSLKGKITIILTTHYMEEADVSDRVIIIDGGKLSADGSPAELKNKYSRSRLRLYGDAESIKKELEGADIKYEDDGTAIVINFEKAADASAFIAAYPAAD